MIEERGVGADSEGGMPCDYSIDRDHLLVRMYAWGEVTDADLLGHQQRIEADEATAPDFSQLVDVRAVTGITGVTAACLEQVARRHFHGLRAHSAFLIPRPDRFGLSRLLDAYVREVCEETAIGVFHDLQQALVWLETSGRRSYARAA
jgi:hypothetical protein